jgi:catecholate siderophore receptor
MGVFHQRTADRKGVAVRASIIAMAISVIASGAPEQSALAQSASPVVSLDIPAQDLNGALQTFAATAGFQLSYDAAPLQGLRSNPVRGSLSPAQALDRLLAGTGITYSFTGPNLVRLTAAASGAAGDTMLAPVSAGADAYAIDRPVDVGYKADRIVTATKTDTPLLDVPQAVSVVTRAQIEDQAITNMAEALRYVPGLGYAQGEGNRDTPVIRGNSSTTDFFLDGIRDDVQYFRDVYNIERVEFLKGPNAMIFGRGGVGGVVNRVTRQANWDEGREIRLEGGTQDHYRGTFDVGQPVNDAVALRLTGLYQDSGSFRDGVDFQRWGLNPTASFKLGENTLLQVGYEHFHDERTADRGIPSFQGVPLDTRRSTFFGDPEQSPTWATVDSVNVAIEHDFGDGLSIRNRTRYAEYDKFYQNVFPGAVNGAGTTVQLQAYNNATARKNLINQTDLNYAFDTGSISHTLLAGVELGRQETDNLRNTGFFNNAGTSINVPVSDPNVSVPITFRLNGTDADNHGVAKFVGIYLQDQVKISEMFQVVAGIRYDYFDVDFTNFNPPAGSPSPLNVKTTDNLWSPRFGLIFKPAETVSIYASYTLTYLPRSGEQLGSLTLSNAALQPERYTNYELGLKWDITPAFQVSAAIYQLDRTNVLIPDPADATKSILAGAQTTKGIELSASGNITDAWSIIASYAYQEGEFTKPISATVPEGNWLANLPRHNIAIWNRYDITSWLGAGVGVTHQTRRFAATDNLVYLPSYTRVDAAVYFNITETITAQINMENLLGEKYFFNAHSNNNISPGAPFTVKVGLGARF